MRARAQRGRFDDPPPPGEESLLFRLLLPLPPALPRAEEELRAQSVQIIRPGILTPTGKGNLGEGVLSALKWIGCVSGEERSASLPPRSAQAGEHRRGRRSPSPGALRLLSFFPAWLSSPRRDKPQKHTNTRTQHTHVHALKKKRKEKSASDLRIPHTDRRRGPSTRSELPREQFQIGTEK